MVQDQTIENLFDRFVKIAKDDKVAGAVLTLAFVIRNSPIGRTDLAQTALEKLIPKNKY